MTIIRIILDGILMSAIFNITTGMLFAINPVFFTTCYPKEIQKVAPKNPNAIKDKLLFTLFLIIPLLIYSAISKYISGINGFWALFRSGYIEWFLINLGDFFGLDIYLREKLGKRFELPGTEGHPFYKRKEWLKSLALPEHFILWPLVVCPLLSLCSVLIGMIIRTIF